MADTWHASLHHSVCLQGIADTVPKRVWRKGSQWFALTRKHAELAASETVALRNPGSDWSTLYA